MRGWLWANYPDTAADLWRVQACLYAGSCTPASVVMDHPFLSLLAASIVLALALLGALAFLAAICALVIWLALIALSVFTTLARLLRG